MNNTQESLGKSEFGVFLVIILGTLLAVMTMIIFTMVIVYVTKGVHKMLKVYLINLLFAGLLMAIFGIAIVALTTVLIFAKLQVSPPDLGVCRFLQWGYIVSATVRLYSLAAFSVAVLLIIRWNQVPVHKGYIVTSIFVIWSMSLILNTHIISPPIFAVQYYDGVVCFPKIINASIIVEARYVFTSVSILFGGIVPLLVSTLAPVIVLCYIKQNTVTGEQDFNKPIARFALFLVLGNGMNFIGQTVVGLIVYSSEVPAIYMAYSAGVISLMPTPIMIMAFLKKKLCKATAVH